MSGSSFSPAELPALVLAYLGDVVWEAYVRRRLVKEAGIRVTARALHEKALKMVSATAQASVLKSFEGALSEEEITVMKRGRRTRARRSNRPSTMSEYRNSTGFEALLGYLDLKGEESRLDELMGLAFDLEAAEYGRNETGE